ncbi:FadR/GntR family transcriptional regulator [Amnibacterium flavum]|uniref:GntR family transcriptional regulator n=1 Tax=Amnibacterium flavum TaxID=2173173 RepID=A0A2V1HTN5_9MICO|nr:GntR family transcriptional regulator [Amnibacterium flavum]PVZ95966.1 GntR family transcriptional regulator [Amnibacterium flavum]
MSDPREPVGAVDDVLFRPVRSGNAFEDTVQRLLQTVRLGVVAPGESLPPERDLAARLGVSRDTVRDAIRALSDAGYLVARRGRYGGTFVSDEPPTGLHPGSGSTLPSDPSRSAAEIDDVLGLRDILEPGAARAAAARTLSATDRELLWSKLLETAASGVDDYRRTDSRLHLAIGELAGIPSLLPLLVENRSRVTALLDEIPLLERNIRHSNEQHELVVTAILRGDPDAAERAMAEHLSGSAALLRGFLG